MDNPRPEKVAVVDEVKEKLSSASAAILTEYRGLKVKDMAALRRSLRDAGGEYRIYKNTLVRFAAQDLGLELDELLTGPTAITFIDGDAVAVAKALRDYGRTNPALVVKGGLLGQAVIDAKAAAALADMPSREVLLARIAGGLAAPMVQFAGLLQALPRNFAYGLKALIEKSGGVPEGAADAEAEAAAPAEADATAPADAPEADAAEAPAAEAPEAPTAEADAAPAESTPEPEAATAEAETTEAPAAEAAPEPEPEPEPEAPAADAPAAEAVEAPSAPADEPLPADAPAEGAPTDSTDPTDSESE